MPVKRSLAEVLVHLAAITCAGQQWSNTCQTIVLQW
jgi:hypothetical protein